MATRSALINVMHKAATVASRNMLRDFGEVENLQVSRKGPADFVSRVDTNAERAIKAELERARPRLGLRDGRKRRYRQRRPRCALLDCGSAGWHYKFSAWHSPFSISIARS